MLIFIASVGKFFVDIYTFSKGVFFLVFSSPIFLFLYLPVVLLIHFLLKLEYRNTFLLTVSLIFYSWGEPKLTVLMVFSIILNYLFGLLVEHYNESRGAKVILALAVITNLGLLLYYKYINFFVDNINGLFNTDFFIEPIDLPLGISFYTFHSLSYVVDIYRRKSTAQKNMFDLALYISFFPQLVAGPIVRYHDIQTQLENRLIVLSDSVKGFRRFLIGLGKKVLIANPLGLVADGIFALDHANLNPGLAWIGIICYSLQIYFDFSGYSDMAIGIAKVFGFNFLENFNYPYIAKNIQDFWRRWHISLSNWFRDYLYIPLGGNRISISRTYINLLIVFFCTGFWHGSSWSFVIWGLFHGLFLIFERMGLRVLLERLWSPLQHAYTLLIIMVGWIFFRAENLEHAVQYLSTMFGLSGDVTWHVSVFDFVNTEAAIAIAAGVIGSSPYLITSIRKLERHLHKLDENKSGMFAFSAFNIGRILFYISIFVLVSMSLANQTYNPFIYFRF